jgi:hypothetical protein
MATESNSIPQDPKYDNYDYPTVSENAHPGHPGHTTPEQDAQVHLLRMKLESLGYTERLDTLTLVRLRNLLVFRTKLIWRCSCDFCELESSMWPLQRRCELPHSLLDKTCAKQRDRFVESEAWRKEFGLDDLVRNFDYKEKPQVFEYYPQYYHKTDKVR